MIKQVALISARAGMSRADFIARYEVGHVPLALEMVPYFSDYRRSFVRHDNVLSVPSMPGSTTKLPFDVITEMLFADRAHVDALAQDFADPAIGSRIAADEAELFDRSRIIMFEADEFVTPSELLKAAPESGDAGFSVKMIGFLSKRANIDRAEFIDRYENHNVRRALDVLRPDGKVVIGGYSRIYPRPDALFALNHVAEPLSHIGFDVMTQFWFRTERDFVDFMAVQRDPAVKERLSDSDDDLFDRTQSRFCLADEYFCSPADLENAKAARIARL